MSKASRNIFRQSLLKGKSCMHISQINNPEIVLILATLTAFKINCLRKIKTLMISLCNDCKKHHCDAVKSKYDLNI